MTWIPGRQGGGYFKRPLLITRWFDSYLLKYPEGSEIRTHTDPVPGKRHFRLNITLHRPTEGGVLLVNGPTLVWFWRICLFRPDAVSHSVTKVTKGERLDLSIGWARVENPD